MGAQPSDLINTDLINTDKYFIGQSSSWTQSTLSTTLKYTSVSCSSNGKYVATCVSGGNIWISSDYGTTWSEKNTSNPNKNWNSICMSANGKFIYACESTTNYIWKSSDYGDNFTSNTSITNKLNFITCSSDAQCIMLIASDTNSFGYLYISTDSGNSYTLISIGPSKNGAISNNGKYMFYTLSTNGRIFYSHNYGLSNSWYSQVVLTSNPSGSAMSSNGSIGYVCVNGGYIYKSTDLCLTWQEVKNDAAYNWNYITCSSSGKFVLACTSGTTSGTFVGGNIWLSSDFGLTWTNTSSTILTKNWISVSTSGGGQYSYCITQQIGSNGSNGLYKYTKNIDIGDFFGSFPDYYETNFINKDSDSLTTTSAPSANWSKIAMSTDGINLIACRNDSNKIYYSTDNGSTWTQSTSSPTGYWYDCAMSYSGQFAIACQQYVTNGGTDGNVFISNDFGVTWTNKNTLLGAKKWTCVASSYDGKLLIAAADTSNPFISNDYGSTWTAYSPNIFWNGFAISYDKKYIYGCSGSNGYIYRSVGDTILFTQLTTTPLNMRSISCSHNGQYIVTTTISGYIYISNNFGVSWTYKLNSATRNWSDISISYSGKYIVGCVNNGNIYLSTDYGDTWTDQSSNFGGTKSWSRVGISSTGKYIFATEQISSGKIYKYSRSQDIGEYIGCFPGNYNLNYKLNNSLYIFKETFTGNKLFSIAASKNSLTNEKFVVSGRDYIYTSTDYGETWVKQTGSGSRSWVDIACSNDGNKIVAVDNTNYNGYIYVSTDLGVNWTQRGVQKNWLSVCCSSNGTKMFAAANADYIYYSSDSGVTWTQKGSIRGWYSVRCSSDGSKRIACVSGGQLYISIDTNANTWTAVENNRYWKTVACSGDGTYMLATVEQAMTTTNPSTYDNYIYVSSDSGSTWSKKGIIGTWIGVSSSYNGDLMAAVNSGGKIYLSNDYGVTWVQTGQNRTWFYIFIAENISKTYIYAPTTDSGSIFIGTYSSNENLGDILTISS